MDNKIIYKEFYSDPEIFTLVLKGKYEEARDKVIKKRRDQLYKGQLSGDDINKSKLYYVLYLSNKNNEIKGALEDVITNSEELTLDEVLNNDNIKKYVDKFENETKGDALENVVTSYILVMDQLYSEFDKPDTTKVAHEGIINFVNQVKEELENQDDKFIKYFIVSAGTLLSFLTEPLYTASADTKGYAEKLLNNYKNIYNKNDLEGAPKTKQISDVVRKTLFEIIKSHVEGIIDEK